VAAVTADYVEARSSTRRKIFLLRFFDYGPLLSFLKTAFSDGRLL